MPGFLFLDVTRDVPEPLPAADREGLPVGSVVKLLISNLPPDIGWESVDVAIEEAHSPTVYIGRLVCTPATLPGLAAGDPIVFGAQHVVGVARHDG